jgi:hypothetical protein
VNNVRDDTMKIIKYIPILGMAYQRSMAIKKISGYGEKIDEHIIKCVVYKNTTGNLWHWVHDELATWFDAINQTYVKGNGSGKLKEKDYADNVFGWFGDAFGDARINLSSFRVGVAELGNVYPDFEITYELQRELFEVDQAILSTFPKIFSQNNSLTKEDLFQMLWEILGE